MSFWIQAIGNYTVHGITLGKGNFAKVKLATHKVIGAAVALKIININEVKESYVLRNLEREVKILARLNHPNIVKLYEALWCNKLYCISMEYIRGGDLSHHIKSHPQGRLLEVEAKNLFRQMISAVGHMHRRGLLHRDLKLENIMMSNPTTIKIVDFGLSNFYNARQVLKTRCGSPEYAAPELFVPNIEYGPAIDMWSLGVILYVMVVGAVPFVYSKQDSATVQGRRNNIYKKSSKGLVEIHRKAMGKLTKGCRDLIHGLIQPNQSLRYKLEAAEQHTWLFIDVEKPFQLYQPNPSLYRQCHPIVIQRISTLIAMNHQEIERQIHAAPYNKIYAMYHLLMDIMVKNAEHANQDSPNPTYHCNTYLGPCIPYYYNENFGTRQNMKDDTQNYPEQRNSRIEGSRKFTNATKGKSRIQEESRLFNTQFSKEESIQTMDSVPMQDTWKRGNEEQLRCVYNEPIHQIATNISSREIIPKHSKPFHVRRREGLVVNIYDGNNSFDPLPLEIEDGEHPEALNSEISDVTKNSNISERLNNLSVNDDACHVRKSEYQTTRKMNKHPSSYHSNKKKTSWVKRRSFVQENVSETMNKQSDMKSENERPELKLSATVHPQNYDMIGSSVKISCSKPPATAIGIRDSKRPKPASKNIQIIPNTSHGVREAEEKYTKKVSKPQQAVAILKRPTQQPIIQHKTPYIENNHAEMLFVPNPCISSSNRTEPFSIPKPITTKLHGNVSSHQQINSITDDQQYNLPKGRNATRGVYFPNKGKPLPLYNDKYGGKTADELLGKVNSNNKLSEKFDKHLHILRNDNHIREVNKSKYLREPFLPPLFKRETSKKEIIRSSSESLNQRLSRIYLREFTSQEETLLSSGDAAGRELRYVRDISPTQKFQAPSHDKPKKQSHYRDQTRSTEVQHFSRSEVERTAHRTRPRCLTNTQSTYRNSDVQTTSISSKNYTSFNNQLPLDNNTRNFPLNRPKIEGNYKYRQSEMRRFPNVMPSQHLFKTHQMYKRDSTIVNKIPFNSNVQERIPRTNYNLLNVTPKVDTGLTDIGQADAGRTPSRRYSEIRAAFRKNKQETKF